MRTDAFFGNVCELDLVFNFYKVYAILDEVFLAGEIEETSKHVVLARLDQRKPLLTLPRNIRTGTDTWWVWQLKNSIDPSLSVLVSESHRIIHTLVGSW